MVRYAAPPPKMLQDVADDAMPLMPMSYALLRFTWRSAARRYALRVMPSRLRRRHAELPMPRRSYA